MKSNLKKKIVLYVARAGGKRFMSILEKIEASWDQHIKMVPKKLKTENFVFKIGMGGTIYIERNEAGYASTQELSKRMLQE